MCWRRIGNSKPIFSEPHRGFPGFSPFLLTGEYARLRLDCWGPWRDVFGASGRKLSMARNAIVGPNPIGTVRLTSDERLKELSSILALGATRLRLRREAQQGRADGQL